MKAKLIRITLLFTTLLLSFAVLIYVFGKQADERDLSGEIKIALNEIAQLSKEAASSSDAALLRKLEEKAGELRLGMDGLPTLEKSGSQGYAETGNAAFILMVAFCILFLVIVFLYVYIKILRPFEKMGKFANDVAAGNFDLPLEYDRANYFGAFTWAFDMMRQEITKARVCEREAIENNKTVIATLSHDIKTPIASIRAYAEALEANMDHSPEKRAKYTGTIVRKCDEVTKLTNDLFLHSLASLDKLRVTLEETDISASLAGIISDLSASENSPLNGRLSDNGGHIGFTKPPHKIMVMLDRKRFEQVIGNLISNAGKYAKTQVDICLCEEAGNAVISIRDYGNGIPDEDMPFIFDKFYRGRNCGTEQGSGLGLYIAKYIICQMNGRITLRNLDKGLEIKIFLPSIRIS